MNPIAGAGMGTQAMMAPMATSMMTTSTSLAIICSEDEDDEKTTILIATSQQSALYTATGAMANTLASGFASGGALDVTA